MKIDYECGCKWDGEHMSVCDAHRGRALMQALAPSVEGVAFPAVLEFYADRLVHIHHESENVDYIQFLRRRAKEIREAML